MAAPTDILLTLNSEEYSRFEPDKSTVTVFVTPEGSNLINEQVTLEFVKARRNNDVIVATKTLTLTSNTSIEYSVDFDLNKLVDSTEVPLVRRGYYLIRATSVTDTNITKDSVVFKVSLITVDRLKGDYLHGTDQRSSDVLSVHSQPTLITGVTVTGVSRGHPQRWYPLTYNYTDDGAGTIVRTLSWCDGPIVSLTTPGKTYTLRRGSSTADYIDVRIGSFGELPTVSIAEQLLIERSPFDSTRIQKLIDQAISWIEDSELGIFLEPTRIQSKPKIGSITFDAGSDIPNFVNTDFDDIKESVSFHPPSNGTWINFKFPYRPLLRFDELYGQISNTRIVDIALEWVEAHEKGAFVELVPFNQELAFNFIGLIWVESIRGPTPLPNFWNYDALVGFRKTPEVLLELVAKKAAMDILTIAGQAFRGGFSSQSISRDGISESVSYTASATYGIYSATIEDYRKWIEANLAKLKGSFRGGSMVVV